MGDVKEKTRDVEGSLSWYRGEVEDALLRLRLWLQRERLMRTQSSQKSSAYLKSFGFYREFNASRREIHTFISLSVVTFRGPCHPVREGSGGFISLCLG